jgi:hypothetical protein
MEVEGIVFDISEPGFMSRRLYMVIGRYAKEFTIVETRFGDITSVISEIIESGKGARIQLSYQGTSVKDVISEPEEVDMNTVLENLRDVNYLWEIVVLLRHRTIPTTPRRSLYVNLDGSCMLVEVSRFRTINLSKLLTLIDQVFPNITIGKRSKWYEWYAYATRNSQAMAPSGKTSHSRRGCPENGVRILGFLKQSSTMAGWYELSALFIDWLSLYREASAICSCGDELLDDLENTDLNRIASSIREVLKEVYGAPEKPAIAPDTSPKLQPQVGDDVQKPRKIKIDVE